MNVTAELDEAFPEFFNLRPDFDRHRALATLFRQLAIGSLLLTADARLFYAYLFRGARAFLAGLETAPVDRFLTSRFTPFLDAVACRDDEGARRIAASAPRAPDLDREYEEDFLYLHVLMTLYSGDGLEALPAAIERFAELTAENPDPRQPVCAALFARDSAAFAAALADAIDAIEADTRARIETETIDPDEAALSTVSIDVLAWLELAGRAGLPAEPSYSLAPAVARAFHRRDFPHPESWREGTGGL
jgi:hypothetical protein